MFSPNGSQSNHTDLPPGHQISFDAALRASLKYAYVTRPVPAHAYGYAVASPDRVPRSGDLVLAQVKTLNQHNWIEAADGRRVQLVERDLLVSVYGNCYATHQYEGLVPHTTHTCQLLNASGICGLVLSKHTIAAAPTELAVLGFVHSPAGDLLNLADFGLPPTAEAVPTAADRRSAPLLIAVVGSGMRSGKTVTASSLIRGLTRYGYRSAACKVTGTASSNDGWAYHDHGASEILDFVDCGVPGTYLCHENDLLRIFRTLYHRLSRRRPDVIVIELGDGLAQRETSMLLNHPEVRASIDGVLYSPADSLAAEGGVRWLQARGYRILGMSGLVSASPLAAQEAEEFCGIHCFTREELMFSALDLALPQPCSGTGNCQ